MEPVMCVANIIVKYSPNTGCNLAIKSSTVTSKWLTLIIEFLLQFKKR